MKSYNIPNYLRYKEDLARVNKNNNEAEFKSYSRDQLISKFLPLVENIAKKFSTADQASGILDINDLIQEGSIGLIMAVDKIDWDRINESENQEQTIKSFLSKRIKGRIRYAMNVYRGTMRVPEYKINEIRRNPEDKEMVEMFFNSIFKSIDVGFNDADSSDFYPNSEKGMYQYEDKSSEYNIDILNAYLLSIFKKHLTDVEANVLRLSYGLDCDKHSAKAIAEILDFKGPSAYVRVSELKKFAISKLIANVDSSQVIDFM
jgi:RNA polymerase sigma factor (sigma-70 family)